MRISNFKRTFIIVALSACAISTAEADQPRAQVLDNTNATADVFSSVIYQDVFSTGEMRSVFSDERRIEDWLRVERTLASVQASLGVIPKSAAAQISNAARPEKIDLQELKQGMAKVGRPIAPLLQQICAGGSEQVCDYLHWGATTQDVLDTASVMEVRDALSIVRRDLVRLALRLADMAEQYKDTPFVARSNGQDAVPTSFGLLLSSYIAEITRDIDRVDQLNKRVLVGEYGSAVGTLSAAGPKGLEVRRELMKRLDLGEPSLSWNASRDNLAESIQVLALVNAVAGRIGEDINLWSRIADNSVNEGQGGASSTMPQKRNPRMAETLSGISKLSQMRAMGALQMMEQSETRQGGPWMVEWATIPEMFMLTSAALHKANDLFDHLIVRPEVMRERFNDSNGFIMSEAVMSDIAPKIGRGKAEDLLKHAIAQAGDGVTFRQVIAGNPQLSTLISAEQMDDLLDPTHYLGASSEMVETLVKDVRERYASSSKPK